MTDAVGSSNGYDSVIAITSDIAKNDDDDNDNYYYNYQQSGVILDI